MRLDHILERAEKLNRKLDFEDIYKSSLLQEKKAESFEDKMEPSFWRSNLRHQRPDYKDSMDNYKKEYEDFLGDFNELEDILNSFGKNVIDAIDLSEFTFKDYYVHDLDSNEKISKLNDAFQKVESAIYKMMYTYKVLEDIHDKLLRKYSSQVFFTKKKKELLYNLKKEAFEAMQREFNSYKEQIGIIKQLVPNLINIWNEPIDMDYIDFNGYLDRTYRLGRNDIIKLYNYKKRV